MIILQDTLFIFGSKQALNLSNQQIQGLARRSIIPVFLQTSGEASDDGQDFLLNAKELLNSYIIAYDKYVSSYLVDAGLKRPYLFGDYGVRKRSIFLMPLKVVWSWEVSLIPAQEVYSREDR